MIACVIALFLLQMLLASDERLLAPAGPTDWSAYRLDTEVFGWNKDFSEVAAVCMEVMRGPLGKHRGETYMLVYNIGEPLPKRNITCHSITHADLPHNPLPLEPAKEYLWTIENSYQQMWPKRPKRAWQKGFMRVQALSAMVPDEEPPAGQALSDAASCTPWVGLLLQWHNQRRLLPFRPVDMAARCALLQQTDVRTYWGKADTAACMVRYDFAGRPANEESARFVAAGSWAQGKQPQFVVTLAPGMRPQAAQLQALQRALLVYGPVRIERSKGQAKPAQSGAALGLTVTASRDWLPLARLALVAAKQPAFRYSSKAELRDVVRLAYGPASAGAAADPGSARAPGGGAATGEQRSSDPFLQPLPVPPSRGSNSSSKPPEWTPSAMPKTVPKKPEHTPAEPAETPGGDYLRGWRL